MWQYNFNSVYIYRRFYISDVYILRISVVIYYKEPGKFPLVNVKELSFARQIRMLYK